jgi:hypothetical protein
MCIPFKKLIRRSFFLPPTIAESEIDHVHLRLHKGVIENIHVMIKLHICLERNSGAHRANVCFKHIYEVDRSAVTFTVVKISRLHRASTIKLANYSVMALTPCMG